MMTKALEGNGLAMAKVPVAMLEVVPEVEAESRNFRLQDRKMWGTWASNMM